MARARAGTSALASAAASEAAAHSAAAAAAVDTPAAAVHAQAAAEGAARAQAFGDLAKTQPILRLHQEDSCQALGLPSTSKYQAEGGPSPEAIIALLREYSERPQEDVATFLGALAFSWLTGGTDGQAKNYSLLHGGGGRIRLAPLYDLASALPYQGLDFQRLMLIAMGNAESLQKKGAPTEVSAP